MHQLCCQTFSYWDDDLSEEVKQQWMQLELANSAFWTDTSAVLGNLQNDTTRFRNFMANRIFAFLKDTTARGQSVEAFMKNEIWISVSDFLREKKLQVNLLNVEEDRNAFNQLMKHFSSWTKLRYTLAWFLMLKALTLNLGYKRMFLHTLYSQSDLDDNQLFQQVNTAMKKFKKGIKGGSISVEDLVQSEQWIIKLCQKEEFSEEISSLSKGQDVKRSGHLFM